MEEKQEHTEKFEIFVNSRHKEVSSKELTFNQVVSLAFNPPPSGPNTLVTIVYTHGSHENPEGTLLEGGSVKIKNGMRFNVTATNKS
jgi:hypothetical protein